MIQIQFTARQQQELHHLRFHHPDPKVQLKTEVLWLKSQKMPHQTISRLAVVSTRTVTRYLQQYQEGGIERLSRNNYASPKSELDEHALTLEKYLKEHPPRSVKQAQAMIEKLTGIRREETQIRKFLHRRGLKWRKCGVIPGKVDKEKMKEQRKFKEEELDIRLEEAEQGERQMYFVDAAHFVHGAFLGMLWCVARIFLKSPSGRKRFNVLGALDPITKRLRMITNCGYINSESVCQLLRMIADLHPDTPITLVLDNASYQRCKLVQNLAKELEIELLFLPSYSPNLNLIERIWKFVKSEVLYGKYYETFDEFQTAIHGCLHELHTTHQDDMQSLITRNFQLFDKQTNLAA
jgi:transposase